MQAEKEAREAAARAQLETERVRAAKEANTKANLNYDSNSNSNSDSNPNSDPQPNLDEKIESIFGVMHLVEQARRLARI